MMLKIGFWILNNIPLGPLAPWYMGMLLGRTPHKVK